MSGITRRPSKTGTRFMVRVSDGKGGKQTLGTFGSLKEAKEAKARWELNQHGPSSQETCDHFAERWTTDYPLIKRGRSKGQRKRASSIVTAEQEMKPFIHHFMGVPLAKLDRQSARQFALKYPRSARTARAMLNDALDDELIQTNPFADIQLETKSTEIRVPTDEECELLEATARRVHGWYGPMFAAQITFARYVGLRKGELLALQWDWIDLERSEVAIRESISRLNEPTPPKNGQARTVPIAPRAREALLRDVPRFGTYVFTNKRHDRLHHMTHQTLWDRVRHAAGLSDVRWHDLRHWCATALLERGRPVHQVAYQLGHTDKGERVTRRYLHPSEDRMRDEIRRAWDEPTVIPLGTERHSEGSGPA